MTALLQLTTLDLAAGLLLALLGLLWLVDALSARRGGAAMAAVDDPQELALAPDATYTGPGQPALALGLLAGDPAPAPPSPLDTALLAAPLVAQPARDPTALSIHALLRSALPPLLPHTLLAPDLRRIVWILISIITLAILAIRY